ncbi:unnamed protein product [Sphacelaria rigidula]
MVESLIFLAQSTRFDIAFSVSQVARYMGKPIIHHLAAVKRAFRYLKGNPDLPPTYSTSDKNLNLIGYCDASYGNCGMQGRLRSTTGTTFFLAGGPVHFSSSLQRITATSTTENPGRISSISCESLGGHPCSLPPYTRILKENYTFRQSQTTVQAPNTWRLGSTI